MSNFKEIEIKKLYNFSFRCATINDVDKFIRKHVQRDREKETENIHYMQMISVS